MQKSLLATRSSFSHCFNCSYWALFILLWHSHLGYPSHSKLALLNKLILSDVSNKSHCYDVCYFSKQKYFFFHLILIFLKIFLNLYIAISRVPPLLVLLKVSNIFLTIVDDYSKCTCFICLNINLIHRS